MFFFVFFQVQAICVLLGALSIHDHITEGIDYYESEYEDEDEDEQPRVALMYSIARWQHSESYVVWNTQHMYVILEASGEEGRDCGHFCTILQELCLIKKYLQPIWEMNGYIFNINGRKQTFLIRVILPQTNGQKKLNKESLIQKMKWHHI